MLALPGFSKVVQGWHSRNEQILLQREHPTDSFIPQSVCSSDDSVDEGTEMERPPLEVH